MSDTTTPIRRFEFVEVNSKKFWEIAVSGTKVRVNFGRIGTNGQGVIKSFFDEAAATKHADKVVKEKLAKGYFEVPV